MGKKDRNALRFAVGNPNEYRSSIWRLWVEANDVYLASRFAARLLKFSLHQSGIWRLAWTSESGVKAKDSNDRVEKRWQRPAEFYPGWVQGPSVIVPYTNIEKSFEHNKKPYLNKVIWVLPPTPGNKHHLTILFVDSSATQESWKRALRHNDLVLGSLGLRNGNKVVLSQREVPMVEKEYSYVNFTKNDMKITYDSIVPEVFGSSLWAHGTDDNGHPCVMDLALGWENVVGLPAR